MACPEMRSQMRYISWPIYNFVLNRRQPNTFIASSALFTLVGFCVANAIVRSLEERFRAHYYAWKLTPGTRIKQQHGLIWPYTGLGGFT